MRLVIVSHKICWAADNSPSGYATDGGFPLQVGTISELFAQTRIVVPCETAANPIGVVALTGNNLAICPLPIPNGNGWRRKLWIIIWLAKNWQIIWREIKNADAVHALIPGDVGTIGILFALLQKKPLFVRYCGNWLFQKTTAEHIWRWSMEKLAGGRNVMLATGGATALPSPRYPNVKWIFSTSLREKEMAQISPRRISNPDAPKLIIVCRQEKRKGVDCVIESLPLILKKFPGATLNVVGGGSELDTFKKLAHSLKLNDHIIFHGKVAQPKVLALLQQAELFCYPTASEGFPKAVLEALACGLPVVTTPVSVLPLLLGSGCGRILANTNGATIAAAVTEIYQDANLYHKMSGAAIQTARQYTLERWRDFINETLCTAWNVQSLSAANEETETPV